jgi:hypothetical protein
MHNEKTTLVRVAWKANERSSRIGIQHPNFGQKSEAGRNAWRVYGKESAWKIELGRQGLMTEADFEANNLAPYGLTERDLVRQGNVSEAINKVAELAIDKADLEKKNAALMAEIEALRGGSAEEAGHVTTRKSRAKKKGGDDVEA